MIFGKIQQKPFATLQATHYDLFIGASGYEERAPFQARGLSEKCDKRVVFAFKKETDHALRIANDKIFSDLSFESILMDSEQVDSFVFRSLIDKILFDHQKKSINIYVDYSCMTKDWYGALLSSFFHSQHSGSINLFFGYSHGQYQKNECSVSLNRIVKPMNGFCSLGIPSKPTALIVCLGNEPSRTTGLADYFDSVPYLFYTDESYNADFSQEIEILNQDIIANTNVDNVVKFPVCDLIYTNFLIENLCRTLSENFRIIIAPCGPKPFALLSMLNSLMLPDSIEVWRISPGDALAKVNRVATGEVSVLQIELLPG